MKPPLTMERKLTLILIAFFASMLFVVAFLLFGLSTRYDESVYEINNENTRNMMYQTDAVFSETMLLGDIIVVDDDFQRLLSSIRNSTDSAVRIELQGDVVARLSNMLDASDYMVDITLLSGNLIMHHGVGVGLSSSAMEEAAEMAREKEGAPLWIGSDDGSIYLVRLIRRLEFLALDELAVLFIRLDANAIADMLRDNMANPGMRLILASEERLLFSEYPEGYPMPEAGVVLAEIDSVLCFIYRGTMPRSGFSYMLTIPRDSLYGGMGELVFSAFAILLLMFVVFLLILHHIVKRMIFRINALRDKMDAFERGQNFTAISALPGSDEIAALNERFDSMARRYKEVIEDNYQRELMMKDSEIKMLTHQINPHFLYNVLDSIYWLSHKYEADDIASMSYSLASLFRAAVSTEDLVTIGKELELLESFLDIQRSRFPDRISYKVDVSGDVIGVMVPKFSLQPLVENAVKHSVEENGIKTEIVVSGHYSGSDVLLSVSNTGSAFPSDIAEKLKAGKASSSAERIGLQNIDERLYLLFGEGYGLRFRNENGWAIVSFSVPGRSDDNSDSC